MGDFKKQIFEIYSYDASGGNHVFDKIVVPNCGDEITAQVIFESFNNNDSTMIFEQSVDGIHWDDIVDSAGSNCEIILNTNTRKNIITPTGTSGTATVVINGVTKTMTWNTSIAQTITDFVTANAAAYLAVGVTITKVGVTLECKSSTRFALPTIVNASGNLTGTVSGNDETSATVNILGLKTNYLRPTFTANSVTVGTISKLLLIFD